MATRMTHDELSTLLLTLTPAEILALYKAPARADVIAMNLLQRYPDLNVERLLYAAYTANEMPAAQDARLILCVNRVKDAIPHGALSERVPLSVVTRDTVGSFFGKLVTHRWGGVWQGVAVTLNAFEVRMCNERNKVLMSAPMLVATADCLAEMRRIDDPLRTDRVERYRQDLLEIFEAWCAL